MNNDHICHGSALLMMVPLEVPAISNDLQMKLQDRMNEYLKSITLGIRYTAHFKNKIISCGIILK